MATTTTNFGWDIPQSTDLVKDGATAIAALGQDIDTALIDLKGGTTGQILSKASATDLDYTWITNDVGDITSVGVTSPITGGGSSGAVTIAIDDGTTAQKGAVQLEDSTSSSSTTKAATPNSVKTAYDLANAAIPKSLVDAAGDLIYATADDTTARLAIGTAGKVLAVNSGATAPEWVTLATGGMTLLSTTTLSGTSTTVSSIDQTYTDLYVVVTGMDISSDNYFLMRPNGSGSNSGTRLIGTTLDIATDFSMDGGQSLNAASTDNMFTMYVRNYTYSSGFVLYQANAAFKNGSNVNLNSNAWAYTTVSGAITSMQFFAGSSMSGGTMKIYGVK